LGKLLKLYKSALLNFVWIVREKIVGGRKKKNVNSQTLTIRWIRKLKNIKNSRRHQNKNIASIFVKVTTLHKNNKMNMFAWKVIKKIKYQLFLSNNSTI